MVAPKGSVCVRYLQQAIEVLEWEANIRVSWRKGVETPTNFQLAISLSKVCIVVYHLIILEGGARGWQVVWDVARNMCVAWSIIETSFKK